MKANETQIGDWLYYKGQFNAFPFKVESITKKKVGYHAEPNDHRLYYIRLSECKPIPLTAEILEKNGFEVQVQGGGRKDVWTGFGIDCEGDIEVEFLYNIPIHLKIDGGFKGEYYTSANIKYIHQLQHALRLCGITREIIK